MIKKNSILLSHHELYNLEFDVEEKFYLKTLNIITTFFKDVYIKTHPQYEYHEYLNKFKVIKIEKTIPFEFINVKNCKFIVGISGASMLIEDDIPIISLINIVYAKESEEYLYLAKQLKRNPKILFPNSFEEFQNILLS